MTDFLSFLHEQYEELGNFNIEFRLRNEDDWPVTLDYWFGSDTWRQSGHLFNLIGVDTTGGLYCQWIYPELRVPEPPIVFMGSEGDGVGVIASSIADLVEILAQGYTWSDEEPNYVKKTDALDPAAFPEFSARVQNELARAFVHPDALLADAQQQHPDFEAWVVAQAS